MSKTFTPSNKPDETPETPFNKAKNVWDERLGTAKQQAFNWRVMALSMVACSMLLAGGLITVSMKSSIEPYIVQVDGATGRVISVDPARVRYDPSLAEKKYFLGEFVKKIRTVSKDEMVVRNNWLEAYKFLTKKGNLILTSYARENDPFKLIGKYLVSVHIETINPISKNSFQVEWREDVFAYQETKKSLKYSGVFTTTHITPKEKSDLLSNPLGIYIEEMAWSARN